MEELQLCAGQLPSLDTRRFGGRNFHWVLLPSFLLADLVFRFLLVSSESFCVNLYRYWRETLDNIRIGLSRVSHKPL